MENKDVKESTDVDDKISKAVNSAAAKTDESITKFGKWWKDNKMWEKVLLVVIAASIFLACFFALSSCSSGAASGCDKVCR